MVLAQVRLLPAYRRLAFMPSFWAFTFSWAAVVFGAMFWLHAGHPSGWRAYSYLLLAAITVSIGAIAARTVTALLRGQFLPGTAIPPPASRAARTTPVFSPSIGLSEGGAIT